MASPAVEQLAKRLGLGSGGDGASRHGLLDGFPAQVEPVAAGNAIHLRALLRFEAGKEEAVQQALRSGALAAAGVEPGHLEVRDGTAALLLRTRAFRGLPRPEVQEQRVRAVLAVVKDAGAAPMERCGECGTRETGEPALLRGRVARVCASCAGRLDEESRAAQRAYLARPVNHLGATLGALAGAAVGAVAYGGIMVATNRMLWLVPIATGALVAWVAIKAAGRTSTAVQVIAGAATLVSVIAGLLGFVGWQVHQQAVSHGAEVDWVAFLAATPGILVETGEDALFSIAGGLIGAFGAARRLKAPDFRKVSPG